MVRARPIGCEVSKVKVNGVLYSSLQVTAIIASPLRAICDHLQPDRGDISAFTSSKAGTAIRHSHDRHRANKKTRTSSHQ